MIRNSKGIDVEKLIIPNRIFNKDQCTDENRLIKRDELFDGDKELLPNDMLTIVFQITIIEPTMEMESGIVDQFENLKCNDINNFFEEGLFTDCTLVADDGTKFEVNKCILANRSPVFKAMFANEMVEAKEGIVDIKKIKSSVLEQMIQFIYHGKAPKMREMAGELFEAADIYELIRLKMLCERELATFISNENVCKLLVLADRHSAKYLKSYAIKYIQMNGKEVMKSDAWKIMIKSNKYTELINQIFEAIFE